MSHMFNINLNNFLKIANSYKFIEFENKILIEKKLINICMYFQLLHNMVITYQIFFGHHIHQPCYLLLLN
jgi:hypothetical protein